MPRWVKVILLFLVVTAFVYVALTIYWLQQGGPM